MIGLKRRTALHVGFATIPGLVVGGASAWAQDTLSGAYVVNGKPAMLVQATALVGASEDHQEVTVLVFTAKSHEGGSMAAFRARKGLFGEAVVAKVFRDGRVHSADLIHPAFGSSNNTLQVTGILTVKDYSMAGGAVSGHLTSGGVQKAGNDTWSVDLTFKVKGP